MTWKYIVAAGVVLAIVAVGVGFFWPFGTDRMKLRLPGVVEIQEVHLGSKVGGRVKAVKVLEGDLVQPGDLLVEFDVPEVKAQLQQAQARLKSAQEDLSKALTGARPEEKDAAKAATEAARARYARMMAGPRPQEIEQVQSDYDSARAELKRAQKEMDRISDLSRRSASGTVTRTEIDTAQALYERARDGVTNTKARLTMLQLGNRDEDKDEALAQMHQAEANERLLLAGTRSEDRAMAAARVEEAQAKVEELEASLKEADVHAPERALVQVVAVRKGDLVTPNLPIVRVLRADDQWVRIYVPETELGKVYVGQPAEVTVDSYPNRRFPGRVIQVSAESEFTPRNVQSPDERRHQVFGIKVRVEDPEGVFKAGMAADVTLQLR
jgi:multidrug resistance efflux pump